MTRHLGFTGTQENLPIPQKNALSETLWDLHFDDQMEVDFTHLHHGQCIGADKTADELAREMGYYIVLHPPVNISKMAYCGRGPDDWRPKPYLDRNKDIVDCAESMIACPKGPEELRSGTWSTVRYAIKEFKPVMIVWPDGSLEVR